MRSILRRLGHRFDRDRPVLRPEERRPMTLKDFLDAIQDSKIQAELVVSDKGRLQPVTAIRAGAGVVTLVCRPRQAWEAIRAEKNQKKEAARISQLAGEWERQEVERAIQHAEPKQ